MYWRCALLLGVAMVTSSCGSVRHRGEMASGRAISPLLSMVLPDAGRSVSQDASGDRDAHWSAGDDPRVSAGSTHDVEPLLRRTNAFSVEHAESALRALIAKDGSATFLSHDGLGCRGDCADRLVFLRNGIVERTDYGAAPTEHRGTYSVNYDGDLAIRFPDHRADMDAALRVDSTSLLLLPKAMGHGDYSWWPFREERAAREARAHKRKAK
jgi:hypothetical protein